MKEFDYTKWDNKPREMWAWNENPIVKKKVFVVYIGNKNEVLSKTGAWYGHCAEIEPSRRMTNYELAYWLWEGTQKGEFREFKYTVTGRAYNYSIGDDNDEVPKNIKIRVNGGEWKEPLIEE